MHLQITTQGGCIMQDKQIIGEHNRLEILQWLHRFGWLTTRQIAKLVWRNKTSSLVMAQRTLASMLGKQLIIRRKIKTGCEVVLLGSKGARLLKTELNISAKSGAKLLLGNPIHRGACNWYLIYELANGNVVYTEHEIQSCRAPMFSCYGKVPDGLVIMEEGVVWLEVENAWKNIKEREKLIKFCADTLSNPTYMEQLWDDNYLLKVRILAITSHSANAMLRTFAKNYNEGLIGKAALNDIWLTYAPMTTGLIYPEESKVMNFGSLDDLV